MSNGDSSGERARKQQLTALQAAQGVKVSAYAGDSNGRLDLISVMLDAKDEAARIATST